MKPPLCILDKAIEQTKNEYIWLETEGSNLQERVFAYELYHQIRHELEKNKSENSGDNSTVPCGEQISLKVHGEIGKESVESDEKNNFPDLVIHHSLTDTENQALAIEIKFLQKCNNLNLLKDLKKLSDYLIKLRFNYQSANFKDVVFVVIGAKEDDLINRLNNFNINKFRNDENIDKTKKYIKAIMAALNEKPDNYHIFYIYKENNSGEKKQKKYTLRALLNEASKFREQLIQFQQQ